MNDEHTKRIMAKCLTTSSLEHLDKHLYHIPRPEGHILAGYDGFNSNISFTFQAVKNLFPHYTYLCFMFCKFWGDFWVYLGTDRFSQRISKMFGNGKFERFDVVLKLDFEVYN